MAQATADLPEWARWSLGDRLRKAFAYAGVGINEMADELGVDRKTINNWMSGRIVPKRYALSVIALRTGVPIEWLESGVIPTGDTKSATAGYVAVPAQAA